MLASFAMPSAAQNKTFRKLPVSMQLLKHKSAAKAKAAQGQTTTMNNVVASFYTQPSDATENQENYYLVISDNSQATFDSSAGAINATNATVAAIDFYAPSGTGTDLPVGTFKTSGSLNYDGDYSYVSYYNADGKSTNERALSGDINVEMSSDGIYTISFADENGNEYTFSGTLNFSDNNGSTSVYPQIPSDVNTTFTGGMAFYHGNLMDSNTGNIYINLYDCAFDSETGAMKEKGYDLAICAFNRLFGDPKKATIVPGTYTVARNFKVDTFFPGMEIDYSGMTVLMGTYVKRIKSGSGSDADYDYAYIPGGTITITEGDTEGTFNFDIDCTTDRGHKVKGTAKNISFNIVDISDDKEKTVESNLDHDVTLNLDYLPKARIYYLGRTNNCNVFTVDLGSPSGKDCTEGDILRMEFQTDSKAQYLPTGTYELMDEGHLYTNLYAPYKMTRGYFDEVGGRIGTRYEHFAEGRYCVVDTFAFVYSGRVGVEALDNGDYKFNINLAEGKGFNICGEWSGPMELCYSPETGISSVADDKHAVARFLDNNTLVVDGAQQGEQVAVYSLDGQLVLSADASTPADASALAKGVYVVKIGNMTTTKIVKK